MIAIELSFKQLIEAVKQLSPTEKLELNEFIWEESSSVPQEHQIIVNDRMKKASKDSALLLDWDVVSKELKS